MAKKFAEHKGLDLVSTNQEVLKEWEKKDIFHTPQGGLGYSWIACRVGCRKRVGYHKERYRQPCI